MVDSRSTYALPPLLFWERSQSRHRSTTNAQISGLRSCRAGTASVSKPPGAPRSVDSGCRTVNHRSTTRHPAKVHPRRFPYPDLNAGHGCDLEGPGTAGPVCVHSGSALISSETCMSSFGVLRCCLLFSSSNADKLPAVVRHGTLRSVCTMNCEYGHSIYVREMRTRSGDSAHPPHNLGSVHAAAVIEDIDTSGRARHCSGRDLSSPSHAVSECHCTPRSDRSRRETSGSVTCRPRARCSRARSAPVRPRDQARARPAHRAAGAVGGIPRGRGLRSQDGPPSARG